MFAYYVDLAWRRCRQNLPIVALLVLTMAIGIASCMTALTIFAVLAGEPLPGISSHLYVATMDAREVTDRNNDYDSPDSLLQLRDAEALVDAHRAFGQVALAQTVVRVSTLDGKVSSQASGLMAYGPVLTMLGVPLHRGRPWTGTEQAAHDPVAVIDTDLAEKLFGTDNAVGKSVHMGTRAFRVVGVTAPWKPRTTFLRAGRREYHPLGQNLQLFVPVGAALDGGVGPLDSGECGRDAPLVSYQSVHVMHCRWLEAWFSLQSPSDVAAFQRFLTAYAQGQHAAGRFVHPPQAKLYGTRAWMTLNDAVPDDVRLNLLLAGGFLLLCMINVAGLLAARFLRRQADVAIRRALGASKRGIFAQHVVETGLLGLIGGLLALPLTLLGLWIVRMQPVGYAEAAQFNVGVFGGLLLLSLGVGLIVGILPAWRVCRQPPALQIKMA